MNFTYLILSILLLSACNHSDKNNTEDIEIQYIDKHSVTNMIVPATKVGDIPLPDNFIREKLDTSSFAFYLRNLPLDTIDNNIYSYDGSIISTGGYHYSIIKMDIGNRDLQQCADAIMRLRAEYLYQTKQYSKIHFNFLSDGKPRYYENFCNGDKSYKKFRKYLDYIFSYANSSSLKDEMEPIPDIDKLQIGDCFVQKGKPIGHAVIIVDIARHQQTGEKIFLVAQSYMPAQSIHILNNLQKPKLDPWYSNQFNESINFPNWTFYKKDLRRFK